MKILLVIGSLRKNSLNKSLIRYISEINHEGVEMKTIGLNDIPMFNEDLEGELPESIKRLIQNFEWADGIIISTPEYNNSLPAPVRNMLHWLSRKYSKHAIENKKLGITGVSDGGFGTARAQNDLLLVSTILRMRPHAEYRLPISYGNDVFDDQGNLVDERIREKVDSFIDNYIKWLKAD